jgi:ATP-dependent protease ClpP protease subunit
VNVDSVKKAIAWLDDAARAKPDAIVFEINTGGGSTVAGFELAKAIESSSTPITCVVDGEAASMGFYILQSCPVRAMTRRSSLMAHEVSFTIHGRGQPNFWRSIADWIKAHNDAFAEHCAHRLKITLAEYHARTDGGKMWWLNWEEALKVGAVDVVVDSVVEVEKALKKQ